MERESIDDAIDALRADPGRIVPDVPEFTIDLAIDILHVLGWELFDSRFFFRSRPMNHVTFDSACYRVIDFLDPGTYESNEKRIKTVKKAFILKYKRDGTVPGTGIERELERHHFVITRNPVDRYPAMALYRALEPCYPGTIREYFKDRGIVKKRLRYHGKFLMCFQGVKREPGRARRRS